MRTKTTLIGIALVSGVCFGGGATLTGSSISPTQQAIPREPQVTAEKAVSIQRHANRYFHSDVIPKLKDCWNRIQGKGTVEFQHSYRKHANDKWIVDRVAVQSSTLPVGQDAVAVKCMQTAVKDTSFESIETIQPRFTMFWSWPVPLPADFPKQASQLMAPPTAGAGGCDGRGSLPRCWACGRTGCKRACVGGESCRSTSRSCALLGDCATGGPTYVGGSGVVLQ